MQPHYRHENKYAISYSDYLAIRQRLLPVMQTDPHADKTGHYTIRSIYFDNHENTALWEKIDGVQKRSKWRIRYYNDDPGFITLEKKIKDNNLCLKYDAPITEAECRALLAGDRSWMMNHPNDLVRELYVAMIQQQMRPRVLVSYTREPYIYPAGNVRVTFDSNIRTSLFSDHFLPPDIRDISATDTPGDMILEVKYDAYLPEIIRALVQTENIHQQAFSKYGACRRYG